MRIKAVLLGWDLSSVYRNIVKSINLSFSTCFNVQPDCVRLC